MGQDILAFIVGKNSTFDKNSQTSPKYNLKKHFINFKDIENQLHLDLRKSSH